MTSLLAPDARAPARARRMLASHCADRMSADQMDVALLLTSELVSNALWHGVGDAVVDVLVEADNLTVGVTNGGRRDVRLAPAYSWPETGHGLRLVDGLSSRWGVEPAELGKRVWFEVALRV